MDYQVKGQNISVDQKVTNIQAIAAIGAISEERGVVINMMWSDSVNSNKFVSFLRKIKKIFGDEEFIIYLDSLRAHKSAIS